MRQITLTVLLAVFAAALLFSAPVPVRAESSAFASVVEIPAGVAEEAPAPPAAAPTVADAFVGEELTYRIGFWFFDEIAEGHVRLERKEDGGYKATLEAQTLGVIGFLLRYRKDIYVSHMRLTEDGSRFVTERFEKTVDKSGRVRRGYKDLDYEEGVMTWRSWGGGSDEKSGTEEIPEGVYTDDPLAAFYNYRYGVYGPLEPGRELLIKTLPKDGKVPEIFLRVATESEMNERVVQEKHYADYLADVRVDKELFDSKSGEIEILFTGGMVPVYAVAKDIAMYGDVRGTLVEIARPLVLRGVAGDGGDAPPEGEGPQGEGPARPPDDADGEAPAGEGPGEAEPAAP